jgi:hypothetical protein
MLSALRMIVNCHSHGLRDGLKGRRRSGAHAVRRVSATVTVAPRPAQHYTVRTDFRRQPGGRCRPSKKMPPLGDDVDERGQVWKHSPARMKSGEIPEQHSHTPLGLFNGHTARLPAGASLLPT